MSILRATRRALGRGIPSVAPGVETTKYGFTVQVDTPHGSWKTILDEWMPIFEEVGWLNGMDTLKIKDGIVFNDNVGSYISCNIFIEHSKGRYKNPNPTTIELSRESVLIHEFVHHAHLYIGNYTPSALSITDDEKKILRREVSEYAMKNRLETVAEIGMGIVVGYDFPEEVHDIYEKYDGPEEVYEIRRMRE